VLIVEKTLQILNLQEYKVGFEKEKMEIKGASIY
jgi:hypothetical protein